MTERTKLPVSYTINLAMEQANFLYIRTCEGNTTYTPISVSDHAWLHKWLDFEDEFPDEVGYVLH